ERYVDGDKLGPPTTAGRTRKKGKRKKESAPAMGKKQKSLIDTPFIDLPDEVRDAFLHGTKRRLTFRQGDYKYESDWKGALKAMKERFQDPPTAKVREALYELVAPTPCPVCKGARL